MNLSASWPPPHAATPAALQYFFAPETKGESIEQLHQVFKRHWFWGRWLK